MTSKLGSQLSREAIALLNKHGVAINIISAGEAGWPDIVGCVNGMFIGIEIKGRGDTLKPVQSRKLRALYNKGAIVKVATSLTDVYEAIQLALAQQQGPKPPELLIKEKTI